MSDIGESATRLLSVLRSARAYTPAGALTDAELARRAGVPRREVIDLAMRLLAHGYLVLARVTPPYGRWLVCVEGVAGMEASDRDALLRAAYQYADDLDGRARAVFVRAAHVRRAIGELEVALRRQGTLFEGRSTSGQWR
ncbi:MAG TPA: hypothetical protein PKC49_00365 [Phycisphaerae bacterium]|nr:hypothetical protein [Phycisphaerae bacterium]